MAEPLQYLLITLKVVALEKVSFSDKQNPRLFVNTLMVNGKHYLLTRDSLTQRIQIILSQKQRIFFNFFFFFFLYF